jgi:hypothetical protein
VFPRLFYRPNHAQDFILGNHQPSLRDCSVTDPDPGFYMLPLNPPGLFIRRACDFVALLVSGAKS